MQFSTSDPKRPPIRLSILIFLYFLGSLFAIYRMISTASLDLFSAGMLPVLVGLILRTQWAGVVLKIYLGIQTLGFTALGVTAVIAYQVSPEDVRLSLFGRELSVPIIALAVLLLLLFQWWIAFSKPTREYLSKVRNSA
ncbi:hypothetical protein LZP69_11715 [Shewanella sp. AS1]|uniref:hypothetical protein n=1 Tax=Shewanella sp. AS1 TaxID=2907626 RepID=UPI001F2B68D2|nr:hypothetical protein [Shewanella sp. AS1]MCE9679829.1 hypothetical protein [Shewanella sp. AS1]